MIRGVCDFPIKQTFSSSETRESFDITCQAYYWDYLTMYLQVNNLCLHKRLFSSPSLSQKDSMSDKPLNTHWSISPLITFIKETEKWSHFVLVTKAMKIPVIKSNGETRYASIRTFYKPAQLNYMFCWFESRPVLRIFERIH